MHCPRSLFLAALALAAGAALAADPVKLDKAGVETALSGKSVSYANQNGSAAVILFGSDGRATYRTGNTRPSIGTWTVDDSGRYCVKFSSGVAQDHCRSLWKTDAGWGLGTAKPGELVSATIE